MSRLAVSNSARRSYPRILLLIYIKIGTLPQIKEDLKNDLFILMLFDDLLKDSELTDEDIAVLDRKMKRDMMEKLGWRL